MPRPRKCRKVCRLPEVSEFRPVGGDSERSAVVLSVDEYETVRLIDKQGFSQEECGKYMQIARSTVQMVYDSARKKLAEALVDGLPLKIEGGDIKLCDCMEEFCGCGGCKKHRMRKLEESKMKIAIPLDENKRDVCIVLARAPYFLFKDGETQTVAENPAADTEGGAGVKAAQFLVDQNVDVLITVRCGQNAADVFTAADMKIYKSQGKTAEENLAAFADGKLAALTHFHEGYHGNH